MPILDADHLGREARIGQGVIPGCRAPLIAVGVGVGAVEAGVEVDKAISPLPRALPLSSKGLTRQEW